MSFKDDFGPNSIVSRFDENNAHHVRAYLTWNRLEHGQKFSGYVRCSIVYPSGYMGLLRSKMEMLGANI